MPKSIWVVNFDRYNPPPKDQSGNEREGGPLKWVRLQCDWMDDEAVFTLPDQRRWIWPALISLAGRGSPRGRIAMGPAELALRLRTTEANVTEALTHLWHKGRIRYSRGGEKMAAATGKVAE